MKNLALIIVLCSIGSINAQSSSQEIEMYERYENGELVEQRQSATENGVPIEGFDFDAFKNESFADMDFDDLSMEDDFNMDFDKLSTNPDMDARMKEMQAKSDLRFESMKAKMDQRMQEMQNRSAEMEKRMNSNKGEMQPSEKPALTPQPQSKPAPTSRPFREA